MQVHVKIAQDTIKVDETFTGANADEIVGKCKARVASQVPFFMRPVINGFSNLDFAREVVKRFNSTRGQSLPIPQSCEEFLQTAQKEGFATIS
jgi:hypothetical protein